MNLSADFKFEGDGAIYSSYLIDKGIYPNNAELFFVSSMIALFESEDKDLTVDNSEKVRHVSRTFLNKRHVFKGLLNNFILLDRKLEGEPLTIKEIFYNDNEEETEVSTRVNLNTRANYGVEQIHKIFSGDDMVEDLDFIQAIHEDLKTKDELDEYFNTLDFNTEENIDDLLRF